jgi:hypothetical protein
MKIVGTVKVFRDIFKAVSAALTDQRIERFTFAAAPDGLKCSALTMGNTILAMVNYQKSDFASYECEQPFEFALYPKEVLDRLARFRDPTTIISLEIDQSKFVINGGDKVFKTRVYEPDEIEKRNIQMTTPAVTITVPYDELVDKVRDLQVAKETGQRLKLDIVPTEGGITLRAGENMDDVMVTTGWQHTGSDTGKLFVDSLEILLGGAQPESVQIAYYAYPTGMLFAVDMFEGRVRYVFGGRTAE